jgi:hypothetical protein
VRIIWTEFGNEPVMNFVPEAEPIVEQDTVEESEKEEEQESVFKGFGLGK